MKNPLISARVPIEVRDRIDRCAEAATKAAGISARPIERGDVVRLLVAMSLPAYEETLGCAPAKQAPARASTKRGKR